MICLRYGSNREDAEDILQNGLISVFRDLHQYDPTKASFSTWSYRVIANAARQYLRKWRRLDQVDNNLEQIGHTLHTDEEIHDIISAKELTTLIQSLPDGYRVVFNMYVLEGFKHSEIAMQLGISINTSKTQLLKAKKTLRKKIELMFEY